MLGLYSVLVLFLFGFNPSQCGMNKKDFVTGDYCCSVNSECFPSQSKILELENALKGHIILPNMYEYINESRMYNTIEQRYPSIIVMVESADDIKHAVMFANEYNLRVTIRSSGHDYSGRSTWDGSLNINLSKMKEISINLTSNRHESGELTVQTGLQWIEIYTYLDKYDRTIVGGSGKTVTPGGYTLGGGHSPISRTFGYAVDNVLEIQVVLPDGRIATCTESKTVIQNNDLKTEETIHSGELFWALRGGGGGTFGVVVYYVFKVHQAPSGMVVLNTQIPLKVDTFSLDWTNEAFWIIGNFTTLPTEWGGYYLLGNQKMVLPAADTDLDYDLETTGSLILHMNKYGPLDGTEEDTFKFLIDFCKANQIPYTFTEVSSFLEYAQLAYDPPLVRAYLATTLLQPEKQTQEFTDFFNEAMFGTLKDAIAGCTGTLLGGHVKDFDEHSTPLHSGYRTASASLACGLTTGDAFQYPVFHQATWDEIVLPGVTYLSEGLQHFGSGMYFNEPTKNHPRWKQDFWGDEKYQQLLEIKAKYDPYNFFTCHHCVGSDLKATKWDGGKPINGAQETVCGYLSTMFAVLSLFAATYIL